MLAPISWRTPPRHYGPWEQVTSLLTEALVARGVDVTLFATKDSRTHRVLSFKPQLRLEWRGQDGQNETEQPDHSASLGDSITSSTRIRFSVHTGPV